jgi:hypothetical protein
MLDYVKIILQKVSFSEYLFERELRKSMTTLLREDILELKKWCYEHFSETYLQILNQYFN